MVKLQWSTLAYTATVAFFLLASFATAQTVRLGWDPARAGDASGAPMQVGEYQIFLLDDPSDPLGTPVQAVPAGTLPDPAKPQTDVVVYDGAYAVVRHSGQGGDTVTTNATGPYRVVIGTGDFQQLPPVP